jgi:hypothetical protein
MLTEEEKQKMLNVHSIGPTMVEYIERIGVTSLAELKDEDPHELGLRIDDMLGVHRMNKLGIDALENLVQAAMDEPDA